MITFPNAKINLGLNITEKRADGYHNLETIFYPIHLQDALEVTRREKDDTPYTLHVKGTALEGAPEDNLVVKAYELLKKTTRCHPSTSTCSSTSLRVRDWEAVRPTALS